MTFKNDIHWFKSIIDAGFDITASRSIQAQDGLAWHATLTSQNKKIGVVSNGGFGGPDNLDLFESPKQALTVSQQLLDRFKALPAVIDDAVAYQIELVRFSGKHNGTSDAEIQASILEIEKTTRSIDDEDVCRTVGRMADIKQTVNKLKKSCAKKICWVKKSDADGDTIYSSNLIDTPANRERVIGHKANDVDYFIADLLAESGV